MHEAIAELGSKCQEQVKEKGPKLQKAKSPSRLPLP
jgi:hypothetical protein